MINKIILLTLFSLIIISCGSKTQERYISFEITRMPSEPLESLKGFNFTVRTPYPEDNSKVIEFAKKKHQEELDNYPNKVEEAKRLHEKALLEYEKDLEIARENFRLESEEYNKLSTLEKLARDKKPELKEPNKPKYYKPREPVYREPNLSNSLVYNPTVLSETYLRVDGTNKMSKGENVLVGEVKLYEFESMDTETIVEELNVYNSKSKQTEKQRVYSYVTIYKRPVYIKLSYNGKVIYDNLLENSGEFIRDTSDSKKNLFNIEKKSIEDQLVKANNFINSRHGFTKIQVKTALRYVENEEGKYNDIEKATNKAMKAYKTFDSFKENKELIEAIEIWENALQESNLLSDEARIDEDVTIALLFNLMESNLYLGNPDKSLKYSIELENLELSYADKNNLKEFKKMIMDFQTRY